MIIIARLKYKYITQRKDILTLLDRNRSIEDNLVIKYYLMANALELSSLLDNKLENDNINLICNNLSYEKYEKHRVIYRCGDPSTKYYIILSGEVSLLLPKMKIAKMTKYEYIEYLILLLKYNNYYLFNNCIELNKHKYNIEDDELKAIFENKNKELYEQIKTIMKIKTHKNLQRKALQHQHY